MEHDRSRHRPEIPPGAVFAALAVTTVDGATLVLAATTVGIFRSDDAGESWTKTGADAPSLAFEALALSPRYASDRLLYAAAGELLRSEDGGETWGTVLAGSHVLAVAATVDSEGHEIVLAGTETDGAFRSADGGDHWASANPGLLDLTVLALAVSPDFIADKTAFAGTASGLYRTRNGGQAWRGLEPPVDDPAVQCLAVSPAFARDRTVLAGTEADGLLRSQDGGRTWEVVPDLAQGGVTAVAFGGGLSVAVATDEGLALSADAGATWRMTGQGLGPILSLVFVPLPNVGDRVVAGLASGGVALTKNDGARWERVDG